MTHTTKYFEKENFTLYQGDSLEILKNLPEESVDLIFADPPYFLSNDGTTCVAGKRVKVNKGKWDRSPGFEKTYEFTLAWLELCQKLLKPNGTIFVSGTHHSIFSVGFSMQGLGYKILNNISWFKVNPPPNLSCRYFTHASESIIWAARDAKSKHTFNYERMKELNGGKQMKSLWSITAPRKAEKKFGRHPTQKPILLLDRIVQAASNPGDVILDPFNGSGTTGIASLIRGRKYIGVDLEEEYLELTKNRVEDHEGEIAVIQKFEKEIETRAKKI